MGLLAGGVAKQSPAGTDFSRRFAHAGLGQQGLFDFAEFDPKAAQLDLLIDPAQVVDAAVGAPPHPVAGTVHAQSCRSERVGQKAFTGLSRPVPIALRQAQAADVQFAGHANR